MAGAVGDTDDFLQQLVDECGDLCINGESCTTAPGDLNEDENLKHSGSYYYGKSDSGYHLCLTDCALEAADMNMDEHY